MIGNIVERDRVNTIVDVRERRSELPDRRRWACIVGFVCDIVEHYAIDGAFINLDLLVVKFSLRLERNVFPNGITILLISEAELDIDL